MTRPGDEPADQPAPEDDLFGELADPPTSDAVPPTPAADPDATTAPAGRESAAAPDEAAGPKHRRTRRRAGRIVAWLGVLLVLGFLIFAGVWRLQGGSWERVETPSMGRVAPVGTLLWIKPVAFDSLRVGDVITFHPPGRPNLRYTHRVYTINADHTISTKGVLSAPDPWRLTAGDVLGTVRMRWWGIGWLARAAPVLIIGALVIAALATWARPPWRAPAILLSVAVVLTIAIVIYRPLINAQQLAFALDKQGNGANASYVGTGLLPIRLQAHHGGHVDLSTGQLGSVHVSHADSDHRLRITLRPAVPLWFWIALIASCFLPALGALLTARRSAPAEAAAA